MIRLIAAGFAALASCSAAFADTGQLFPGDLRRASA